MNIQQIATGVAKATIVGGMMMLGGFAATSSAIGTASAQSFQQQEAGSWGGKVRSGPGTNFGQVGSLQEGDPVRLLRNTGVFMGQYPWFEISFGNGRRGFKWGGILCGFGRNIPGTYQRCTKDNRFNANNGGGNNGGGRPNSGGFPVAAQSGGGIVRSGPGLNFRRVTSLGQFENIRVIRNTGVMYQGFPWFEIRFRGGQRGFQLGGLICSTDRPFQGTFDTCANFRNSLNGNNNNNTNNGGGQNTAGFPIRAQSGGGVVRSGPGTNFRRVTSMQQFEPLRVMRNTGVMMNGYPWFEIRFRGGQRGFQWGGLICSTNRPFQGTFDTCANFRNSLAGNSNGGNTGGNTGGGGRANVVTYVCEEGLPLIVEFREGNRPSATYSLDTSPRRTLPARRTGSGMRYADGFAELRGRGNRMSLSEGGQTIANCRS